MKLAFVTGNKGKAAEAEKILDLPIEIVPLELDELQSLDMVKIARHKAETAYAILKRPLIVDDVSVHVSAWEGFPGPFIKYLVANENTLLRHFLKHESDRSATITATIGYHDGGEVHTFSGKVTGRFLTEPRGTHGFGLDPIFIPKRHTKTFAEMERGEKNRLSHRYHALEKLKKYLALHPL